MRTFAWAAAWALILTGAAACTREAGMGPVTRLNETEGAAASFSWAYYTSIVADGDRVAAAWMNQNGKMNRNAMLRRSVDGGQTWSAELALNDPKYANTVSVAPQLAILPGERGIFALWQSRRNEAGQKFVLIRRSQDFGETWSEPQMLNSKPQAFLPVYAARDDRLLVAWTDERDVNRAIYTNRSLDAGATWLPQDVRVSVLPKSEAGGPTVALGDGTKGFAVWEERPHGQGPDRALHLGSAHSEDDGATWSPPGRVDPEPLEASPMWPAMVEADGRLTLVWTGGVSGEETKSWLWISSSTDGGKSWEPAKAVYEGRTQALFHLAAVGSHVYLVWHGGDKPKQGAIYFNASDDGGKSWRVPWKKALRLDASQGEGLALHPRIAARGDTLAVTWQEQHQRVKLALSKDGGRTWGSEPLTVMEESEGGELRNPQVAVTPQAAYVLWERWPDKKKFIKTFADIEAVLPKDAFVRRVDIP